MSTTQTRNLKDSPEVMVRAYGNEPVRLRALADWGEAIEVSGRDATKSIGYPAREVYKLDEPLFEQLRTAYEAEDRRRLKELWEKAEQFRFPEVGP